MVDTEREGKRECWEVIKMQGVQDFEFLGADRFQRLRRKDCVLLREEYKLGAKILSLKNVDLGLREFATCK